MILRPLSNPRVRQAIYGEFGKQASVILAGRALDLSKMIQISKALTKGFRGISKKLAALVKTSAGNKYFYALGKEYGKLCKQFHKAFNAETRRAKFENQNGAGNDKELLTLKKLGNSLWIEMFSVQKFAWSLGKKNEEALDIFWDGCEKAGGTVKVVVALEYLFKNKKMPRIYQI